MEVRQRLHVAEESTSMVWYIQAKAVNYCLSRLFILPFICESYASVVEDLILATALLSQKTY